MGGFTYYITTLAPNFFLINTLWHVNYNSIQLILKIDDYLNKVDTNEDSNNDFLKEHSFPPDC